MPGSGETNGRRPTIRDVAERAGVSKSLVSLVMRGEPMVRDDKRRRVQQAADELGYRMNLAARSLSNLRSKTIGVLVADLRNPLLVDVVERAGQVLEDEGLSTLLISAVKPSRPTSEPRIDSRAIGALKDLRVEAMLVVGSVPDQQALAELLGDMPVVVAAAGADGLRADVVRNDDQLGMRLVVDYLVASGHTAIAHLGGLGGVVAEERVAGYCAAMAQHGLESEIVVAESDFTEDAATAAQRDCSGAGGRRLRSPRSTIWPRSGSCRRSPTPASGCPATSRSPATTTRSWPRSGRCR